jgi:DNA-binding NtrC family response regulator
MAETKRIIVINDDTAFLSLMEEVLRDEGYAVQVIREWDAAAGAVRETRPDLVILDLIHGREERGWTILELLMLDTKIWPVPVIVCSGALHLLHEREEIFRRHGIRPLAKPFDLDELLEQVALALGEGEVRSARDE